MKNVIKRLAIFFISWVCIIMATESYAIDGQYPIQNFTSSDYQAGIQNIDFAQNRDMNLFVANNLGVLSFNGSSWERHAFQTGKKQRSLAFDEKEDRLYVGSQGDFGYFEKDFHYVSLLNTIPETFRNFDEVWDVFIIDSQVYFCTFQGIYIYDGSSITVVTKEKGLNRSFQLGKRLFTQSSAGVLYELEGKNLVSSFKQLQSNQVVSGMVSVNNGLVLFYNSGFIELSTKTNASSVYSNLENSLNGKYINHVLQLADNKLVISTQRAGLYFFDMKTGEIENISKEDGLQTNACLRSFQDYSGNLWVGMQNGIALIDTNSPLRLINREVGIQGSGYEAYDTDEGRYFTTSNGIFFLARGASKSTFLSGTEGPAYGLQMINNKLYAGHHTGLFLLERGRAKRCATTNGLWRVKQLKSNPEYAIGGTYSGLYLFKVNDKQELESVEKIKGFEESSRFFEEDRSGDFWVGQFYKGLYKISLSDSFTEATVINISESSDLPIKEHIILSRIDNELYLGTEEGVYKIDQAKNEIVKSNSFSETLEKNWVYLLEQDDNQNVHVFTEELVGFFKQVSSNNYSYVRSSLFKMRQSFNNDLLNISTNIEEGVLYNANEGFINYRPDMENRNVPEHRPILKMVYDSFEKNLLFERLPFDDKTDILEPIEITEGTKILQFVVESFKYKDVNNQQFRYYLEGFDDNYSTWADVSFKEYTNLKNGQYTFRFQTLNHLGEVIDGRPLTLIVNPPLSQSLPARISYGIGIILILLIGYRIQGKYFKSKEQALTSAKTDELEKKQRELQELKDEQVESELRNVNNLLAASTMNLVVKNELMESIKEEIKELRSNGTKGATQDALKRIIKDIDTNLKVKEDWKQFEYHFDKVHGDFLSRLTKEFLDLTPGEQKLCAFLRLKMDTKEIANLMNISVRGVEVARYRLRKKLDLDSAENLSKFILEY